MVQTIDVALEVGNMNNLLSKVLSVQQANKRLGCSGNALGLISTVDNLLVNQQFLDVAEEILKVLLMEVSDNEAPDGESLADNLREILDPVGLAGVVLRDHSTGDDSSVGVEVIQCGLQSLASDVLKVDVNTIWRQFLECFVSAALLVVECVVESDFLEKVIDLFVRSGYCNQCIINHTVSRMHT